MDSIEEKLISCGISSENPLASLSNYKIQKKIGRGQFSEVYKATCGIDNMVVALKKVKVDVFQIFVFK